MERLYKTYIKIATLYSIHSVCIMLIQEGWIFQTDLFSEITNYQNGKDCSVKGINVTLYILRNGSIHSYVEAHSGFVANIVLPPTFRFCWMLWIENLWQICLILYCKMTVKSKRVYAGVNINGLRLCKIDNNLGLFWAMATPLCPGRAWARA